MPPKISCINNFVSLEGLHVARTTHYNHEMMEIVRLESNNVKVKKKNDLLLPSFLFFRSWFDDYVLELLTRIG